MPAIVVLVKSVPDTWSTKSLEEDFTLDRVNVDSVIDEVNEFAVEQALRLRENNSDAGFRVIALSAARDGSDEALRKALAMGADEAVQLADESLAGSDVLGTTWALHNALNVIAAEDAISLIIAGAAASDGAMGALPGILAEYRQVPALTHLKEISLQGEKVQGVRETQRGDYEVSAALPAIASITDKADKPRFPNFKGIMAAKKAEIRKLDLAAVGVAPEQVGLAHSATAVTAANERSARAAGEIVHQDGAQAAATIVEFVKGA
ncbi:MAG: electron transfer flavoprotein subunit beta/FixA family protein [Corynebacterium sp.]|nr:electron transfer flavoprotein subunit beta/FixA family protein [Corynebacterium sp.]